MFKKKYASFIIILIMITFTAFSNSEAQITLQLGGGGGLTMPEGDFSGTTADYYSGKNYGLGTGFNLHAKAKIGLLGFLVFGQINYSSLSSGSGSIPGGGSIDISQKVVSFRVGPEFNINLPALPIAPYLDGSISLNIFTSNVTFSGVPNVSDANYSVNSASRIGLGVGGGILFALNPLIHLDLGIHYNLMNLFGKSFDTVNPQINQRTVSYLSLNDDKDPAYSSGSSTHIIGNSRSINSLEITATILFGI